MEATRLEQHSCGSSKETIMPNVLTRNPQFSVRFITEHLGEFTVQQTHDAVLSIDVQRQLGQTAGAFRIDMVPRPIEGLPSRTWWSALGAMDFCEIRMWLPPERTVFPLFRGFIDTIALSANFGARGQRVISILGRDYGKLFLNTKLYYPTEGLQQISLFNRWQEAYKELFGDPSNEPPERPAMGENQTTNGPNFSPTQLQKVIFEKFYRPQEAEVLATFKKTVPPPGLTLNLEAATDPWEQSLRTYSPAFFQKGMAPWSDLWTLMYAYQHRPWREMFLQERADNTECVYRSAPWLTKEGQFIQKNAESTVANWPITDAQIVSLSLARSDAQALNFFTVFPEQYAFLGQMAKTTGSMEGIFEDPMRKNPYLVGFADAGVTHPSGGDTLSSRYQRFGFRAAEFSTPYLSMERDLREQQIRLKIADIRKQGSEGTDRLQQAFGHNHLLEDGQMTVRGDDRLQVGDYLRLTDRGNARYYIESVHQEFKLGTQEGDGHFLTHLWLSRGRGHLQRHYGFVG
jgi:hypothetical protein